jgi:hypothetical protein
LRLRLDYLGQCGVRHVYLPGLALGCCVKFSALDEMAKTAALLVQGGELL